MSGVPWLSVLMPVFNGADTLKEALASVASQAEGIEVILVDQGSTDASRAIAERFERRLDLRILSKPDNENWVQNTNLALEEARAPRATLLHQDDFWREGRTALLRTMFETAPKAVLWLHGADLVDVGGRRIGTMAPPFGSRPRLVPTQEVLSSLLVQNTIALPACAFDVVQARAAGGLDETLWYTADWDFWLSLVHRGPLAWHPRRAAAFRLHRGSLTLSGSRDLTDFAAQLEAPIARHAAALDRAGSVERMARASNALNVWLASAFHRQRAPSGPALRAALALGPRDWPAFLRRTQLLRRIAPRLRLLKGGART